jgi:hypothetical protein
MKELFLKNYDKLVAIVDGKAGLDEQYYVHIYQMSTRAKYGLLKDKLVATKETLQL